MVTYFDHLKKRRDNVHASMLASMLCCDTSVVIPRQVALLYFSHNRKATKGGEVTSRKREERIVSEVQ